MRTILINLIAVTSISFCASSMNAQSEKQHEFEEADRATPGCEQIPYSSLRGSCQDQAKHVHEWCDGEKGPLSCKEESTKIVSTIASESFTLERLQKQRRDLVDARDHGENQEAKNKYDAPIAAVEHKLTSRTEGPKT